MSRYGGSSENGKVYLPGAYLPLKFVCAYLLGTLALLFLSPYSSQLSNPAVLVLFLLCALGAFALGYKLSVIQKRSYWPVLKDSGEATPFVKVVIIASSGWFILFSFTSLSNYGASNFGDIVTAALNPGASYYKKFGVYLEQQLTGEVSVPVQIAVITGALYGVLIPVTILYWHRIGLILRMLATFSALSYVAYFVFIGTQKGIGDVLIMTIGAIVAVGGLGGATRARRTPRASRRSRFWIVALSVVLSLGFVVYLANAQGSRIEGTSLAAKFPASPTMVSLFGDSFARGLAAAEFYPINGYIGLSRDLGVPFVFSGGASVPALASYKTQYFGGTDPMTLSYPARAQAITGWPAGQYWSTMYAWLASDLTFPGTIAFMMVFGWFVARMWLGIRYERDPLSLILFCQAVIAIIYIPANNQIMNSRYTALGFVTLLIVYGVWRAFGRRPQLTRSVVS